MAGMSDRSLDMNKTVFVPNCVGAARLDAVAAIPIIARVAMTTNARKTDRNVTANPHAALARNAPCILTTRALASSSCLKEIISYLTPQTFAKQPGRWSQSGLTSWSQRFVRGCCSSDKHRFEEKRSRADPNQTGDQKFSEDNCTGGAKSEQDRTCIQQIGQFDWRLGFGCRQTLGRPRLHPAFHDNCVHVTAGSQNSSCETRLRPIVRNHVNIFNRSTKSTKTFRSRQLRKRNRARAGNMHRAKFIFRADVDQIERLAALDQHFQGRTIHRFHGHSCEPELRTGIWDFRPMEDS